MSARHDAVGTSLEAPPGSVQGTTQEMAPTGSGATSSEGLLKIDLSFGTSAGDRGDRERRRYARPPP
jgi:hypothetical protein